MFTGLPATSSTHAMSRWAIKRTSLSEPGDALDQRVDTGEVPLRPCEGENVGLHDANIDAAQEHDVGHIVQRALAEYRDHPQALAIVQH
jgi:hypothetical protein